MRTLKAMVAIFLVASAAAFAAVLAQDGVEPAEPHPGQKPPGENRENPENPGEAEAPESLVANGGFELGEISPFSWHQRDFDGFDGLTCFWEKKPDGKGMGVRVDTEVLMDEARARWDAIKGVAPEKRPPAALKTPVKPNQSLKTIAAADGVHVISDFIPVEKDTEYRIGLDLFSKKTGVKVFVDGYILHKGRDRMIYRDQKSLGEEPAEKEFLGKWHRYSWLFHPTRRKDGSKLSPAPVKMRVKIFVYWPPGEVWLDNVALSIDGRREKPTPDEIEQPAEKKE